MLYRPPRSRGVLLAAVLTGWAGGIAGLLVVYGLTLDVGLAMFLSFTGAALMGLLAGLFCYWLFAVTSIRYIIDRNALAIQWGNVRQLIPLRSIQRLIPGRNVPEPSVTGLNGPGLHVGRGRVERVGDTLFYSTHTNRDQLLYVVTPTQSYALTVEDPVAFAKAIQQRQGHEAVQVRQAPLRTSATAAGFWSDPWAYGLVAGAVIATIALGGYVFYRYPGLPPTLEIAFPPMGGIIRVGSRKELLQIPLTALAILGVNVVLGMLVHRLERMAAYLLWGAGGIAQVLFAVAAYRALP